MGDAAKAPDPEIATEAAAKLAEEAEIDLAALEGTGAGGNVTKEDVEKAIRERDEAETEKDDPRYTREELLDGGHALTGYSRVVLSGALHAEDRKTFTLDQAKDVARRFLNREVAS